MPGFNAAGFIAAWRFLTRIPIFGRDTTLDDLRYAPGWFPLIGAGIGAAIGGVYFYADQHLPSTVAAVVAVACGLLLTGAFHEDAVADSADALGGGGPDIDRVQKIMKDSRIGTYGSVALWCLLTLRWSALQHVAQPWIVFALAAAWGRWTAAPLLRMPAIGAGLAKDIQPGAAGIVLATIFAAMTTVGSWLFGIERAGWCALTAIVVTWGCAGYLRRRLGGQSGDLLGAANQLVEAAILLLIMLEA